MIGTSVQTSEDNRIVQSVPLKVSRFRGPPTKDLPIFTSFKRIRSRDNLVAFIFHLMNSSSLTLNMFLITPSRSVFEAVILTRHHQFPRSILALFSECDRHRFLLYELLFRGRASLYLGTDPTEHSYIR